MSVHYSGNSNDFDGYLTRPPTKAQRESARQRPTNNIDDLMSRAGNSYPEVHVFENDSDGGDRLGPLSTGDAQQRRKTGFHQSKSISMHNLFTQEFSRVEDHLTSTSRNQRRDATEKEESKLCQQGQEKQAKDTRHTSSRRRSSSRSHRKDDSDRNRSNGRASHRQNSSPARVSHEDCDEKMLLVRRQRRDAMEEESKLYQEGQAKQTTDTRNTSSRSRSSKRSHRKHDSDRNRSNGRSRLRNSSPTRVPHDCEENKLPVRSQRRHVTEKASKLCQEGQEKRAKDTRHTSSCRRSSSSSHREHDSDRNRSNGRSRLQNSSPVRVSHKDCEEKMLLVRRQRRDGMEEECKLYQEGQAKQTTRHTSSRSRSSNRSHRKHDSDRNRSNGRSRLKNSSPTRVPHDCEENMLTTVKKRYCLVEAKDEM